MIILQLSPMELLAIAVLLALIGFAAALWSFCLGRDSVNIELEVKRRAARFMVVGLYRTQYKNQLHHRCSSPPPPPPPRRL